MAEKTPIEQEAEAVRITARELALRLDTVAEQVPVTARLFRQSVVKASHHLGVAALALSNAKIIGLPEARS